MVRTAPPLARSLAAIGMTLLVTSAAAPAADHTNLEEGFPTELQDAFPIPFRAIEVQGRFRYERERNDDDQYLLQPRLEIGPFPNAQVSIGAPFLLGSASHSGSRNLRLDGLYNFNQETVWIPAFAVAGRVELPTGVNAAGVDTRLGLVASKTLGAARWMQRVHLNATWGHEAAAGEDERANRYIIVVGYSMRAGPDAVVVADFVREQQITEGANSNILEAGVRYQLTPQTVLVGGAGVGMGDPSPVARATVGIQHALSFPWFW
jgi:hypothetical protein